MTNRSPSISVTLPVRLAVDSVTRLLFRPFNFAKWFTIGFCAWLAQLGEAGFSGPRLNFSGGSRNDKENIQQVFEQAWRFVLDNLYWILPLAIALMLFLITLGVVVQWLSCRGKFMFLHCVAQDKTEIDVLWKRYRREGNSLFWFRLVFGLVGMVTSLPLVLIAALLVYRMIQRGGPDLRCIVMLIGIVMVLIAVGLVLSLIAKLTTDFVVPVMYRWRTSCVEAWRLVVELILANTGDFLLYLLFQLVIGLATGMLVLAVFIVTCCAACCLLAIPYLGTVLLLPLLVFKRSYSLHYLAQYGREYDVFPVIVTSTGLPPLLAPS